MKFSVVVPLYNCKDYIQACLNSLAEQTYCDFEVVVVNDGSTDSSAIIASEICSSYSNMKMISQENRGLSGARNTGLQAAVGEYVVFIDADDYVEPNLLDTLNGACAAQDIVMFGYHCDHIDGSELVSTSVVAFDGDSIEECLARMDALEFAGLVGYAWNKAYRRKFLIERKLTFPERVPLVEDIDFNSRAITCARGIAILPDALVHYVQRDNRETLSNMRYNNIAALSSRGFKARFAVFDKFDSSSAPALTAPVFELALVFLLNHASGSLVDRGREVNAFIDSCSPLIEPNQMHSWALNRLVSCRAGIVLATIYAIKQMIKGQL